jgi:excisionase family DNA binding protein
VVGFGRDTAGLAEKQREEPEKQRKGKNMAKLEPEDTLLTPAEVAALFRVSPKTVTRWARAGKLTAMRTLGGHRRFRANEVRGLLASVEEHVEPQ